MGINPPFGGFFVINSQ